MRPPASRPAARGGRRRCMRRSAAGMLDAEATCSPWRMRGRPRRRRRGSRRATPSRPICAAPPAASPWRPGGCWARPPALLPALQQAGAAYGLAGVLRSVPALAGQGRCLLPQDALAEAGLTPEAVVQAPEAARPVVALAGGAPLDAHGPRCGRSAAARSPRRCRRCSRGATCGGWRAGDGGRATQPRRRRP